MHCNALTSVKYSLINRETRKVRNCQSDYQASGMVMMMTVMTDDVWFNSCANGDDDDHNDDDDDDVWLMVVPMVQDGDGK